MPKRELDGREAVPESGPADPNPAGPTSEEEMRMFKKIFSDISKGGPSITVRDMSEVLQAMGSRPMSDQEITKTIKDVNTTGSDVINFEDFLSIVAPNQPKDTERSL